MKKFVLLTKADNGRTICYRGEGTQDQIKRDVAKFKNPSELEIYPVVGGRFQKESLLLGSLLGFGFCLIVWKSYAYLHQKLRTSRRVPASY